MSPKPPYLSHKLLRWFCSNSLIEEIEGDLYEQYRDNLEKLGKGPAGRAYTWTVIKSIRPYLFKKPQNRHRLNSISMLTNYMKIARRSLVKQRVYTITNIIGLSTGIISVFLILAFVDSETSYDRHHEDHNRVFRVVTEVNIKGDHLRMASTPPGLAPRLLTDFPEISSITRIGGFLGINKNLLKTKSKQFFESAGYLADSTLFDVLTFEFIKGNSATALFGSQKIVLSATLSEKLFSDDDPIGETVTITNNYGTSDYVVTGVYENRGIKSHFQPAFICSINSGSIGKFMASSDAVAGNNFLYTYIKLTANGNINHLQQQIPAFLTKHIGEALAESGVEKSHQFQKISDIHLHSDLQNEAGTTSNIKYIYMLLSIAIFILAIACINFMNLATAQSVHRAREIGVRKVFGARRGSLVYQFLAEATLLTFASIVISIFGIYFFLPYFNNLTGAGIKIDLLNNYQQLGLLIGIGVVTSLLAGAYPAFYLSSLKPMTVASGKTKTKGGTLLRQGLVTFQFVIAIVLIIGSVVIFRQLAFIHNKPLGFQKDKQILLPLQSAEGIAAVEGLRNKFAALSGVKAVAGITYAPGEAVLSDNLYYGEGGTSAEAIRIQQNDVDFGVIEALGIDIGYGRSFDSNRADNGTAAVLNEAAVKALGYEPATAVGRNIYTTEDSLIEMTIIGVVRDFHFASLHRPIESYMFVMRPGRGVTSLLIQVETENYRPLLADIEASWTELVPDVPFEYYFLQDQLETLYQNDINFASIINSFTAIALIICCLGLFGLSAFIAEQRVREIGIRKVLGASVTQLLVMLNSSFSRLTLIAFLVAAPLGWYLMTKWLEAFAFKISISVDVTVIALLSTMLLSIIVVSYQSLRAAWSNPSETLRNE